MEPGLGMEWVVESIDCEWMVHGNPTIVLWGWMHWVRSSVYSGWVNLSVLGDEYCFLAGLASSHAHLPSSIAPAKPSCHKATLAKRAIPPKR